MYLLVEEKGDKKIALGFIYRILIFIWLTRLFGYFWLWNKHVTWKIFLWNYFLLLFAFFILFNSISCFVQRKYVVSLKIHANLSKTSFIWIFHQRTKKMPFSHMKNCLPFDNIQIKVILSHTKQTICITSVGGSMPCPYVIHKSLIPLVVCRFY